MFLAIRNVSTQLNRPGTAVPVRVLGQPLLIVRDLSGTLRAFHNVCSHRGTRLLEEPQEARILICPYHAWNYDLSGQFLRSKHFADVNSSATPEAPCTQLNLKSVYVTSWLDFVFVNLDPEAASFHSSIQPLKERWKSYDLDRLRYVTSMRYDFSANWKLVVENFLESYHVPFIHPHLTTYSPFKERYQIKLSQHLMGIGTGIYNPNHHDGTNPPTWPLSGDQKTIKAEYFSIFPTFLAGLMPDHLFAWSLEPLAADRTSEHLHFYFVGDESLSSCYETQRRAIVQDWERVNNEDWDIIQRMHAGHESLAFSRSLVSTSMEQNVASFQQLILDTVGTPEQRL